MLEARDVPAVLYWNPLISGGMVNTNVDVASNWTDAYGVRQTAAPVAADDLYFTGYSQPGSSGPSYPSANAEIKSADINQPVVRTYNSIHLLAGYYGTVDFKASTYVGTLELRGGNIAQNDAFYATAGGGHLTVRVHFDWTGGTLNSGPTAGWVHLEGATGIIDPGDGNTVGLGSTFSLMKNANNIGAAVTLGDGTIQGIGLPDILVGALCKFQRPAAEVWVKLNQIGKVEMNGSEMSLHCVESDSYLLLNGGKVTIQAKGKGPALNKDVAIFKGRVTPQGPSVKVTGGTLELEGGATLKATHGVEMTDGTLLTLPSTLENGGNLVQIQGNVTVSGGEVKFGPPAPNPASYVSLTVDGSVTWSGGTYLPRVDSRDEDFRANLWKSSGTFTTALASKIDPVVVGNGGLLNNTWIVIESTDKIQGNSDPTPVGQWTVTKEGNPVRRMGVKGK